MMLFKEILDQPTRGPSSRASKVGIRRSAKPTSTKDVLKPVTKRKVNAPRKRLVLRNKPGAINQETAKGLQLTEKVTRKLNEGKTTSYNADIPSSTPIFTPVKKEKLPSCNHNKSNIPPVSISSSQCSLIELLQQYNITNSNRPPTEKSIDLLEDTLTPEDEEVNPKLHTFQEVLAKLQRTVQPTSKADDISAKQAFTDVKVAFESLFGPSSSNEKDKERNTPFDKSTNSNQNSRLAMLENENISLQRQLRLVRRELQNKENKTNCEGFNLEMAALQCQNATLEKKVTEISEALENTLSMQQTLNLANEKLSMENSKLLDELTMKDDELRKSGHLFSTETQLIKQDVSEALEKVGSLRENLDRATSENDNLLQEIRNKDDEIFRLSELNKGLQSSVSRLLQDLNKVPKPTSDVNLTSLVLKKFDSVLSSPPIHKPNPQRNLYTAITESPGLATVHLAPEIIPETKFPSEVISGSDLTVAGSSCSPSMPTSVSSSMFSVTSRDERDFSAGLACLDADIRKLQDSLKGLNNV
ncbi:uncharacterized protein LOC143452771 [Clavelina lepadiformis]